MPAGRCSYCGKRPILKSAACAICLPNIGKIVFGANRGPDGLLIPRRNFHYGDPVLADVYFSEAPRTEQLQLLGRHSSPSFGVRTDADVRYQLAFIGSKLMKTSFVASTPSTNGFFIDRTHFMAGVDYDLVAKGGPGKITFVYRRSIVARVLAQGSFTLLD